MGAPSPTAKLVHSSTTLKLIEDLKTPPSAVGLEAPSPSPVVVKLPAPGSLTNWATILVERGGMSHTRAEVLRSEYSSEKADVMIIDEAARELHRQSTRVVFPQALYDAISRNAQAPLARRPASMASGPARATLSFASAGLGYN